MTVFVVVAAAPPPNGYVVSASAVYATNTPLKDMVVRSTIIQTPRVPVKNSPVGQLWPLGRPT